VTFSSANAVAAVAAVARWSLVTFSPADAVVVAVVAEKAHQVLQLETGP